jgi:hypothetical protein
MIKDEWFYSFAGKQHGPLPCDAVRDLLQSGQLGPDSLVWRQGMGDWTPASAVTDLWVKKSAIDPVAGLSLPPQPMAVSSPEAAAVMPPVPSASEISAQQAWQMGIVPQSGLAIASLVCGIIGLILCYVNILGALPAVICGHMALRRIRESEFPMSGRGMAVAGLVMGYLGLLFQVAMIGFIIYAYNKVSSLTPPTP